MAQPKFKVGDKVRCKCLSYYAKFSKLSPTTIYTVSGQLNDCGLGDDTADYEGNRANLIRVNGKPQRSSYWYIEDDFVLAQLTIEEVYNSLLDSP
jgi:hypothetical protein